MLGSEERHLKANFLEQNSYFEGGTGLIADHSGRAWWRYIPDDKTPDSWINQFWIKQALLATCSHAGFLFGFFFDPKNEGDMLLRKVE
jgi:cellobiose phosphorylase